MTSGARQLVLLDLQSEIGEQWMLDLSPLSPLHSAQNPSPLVEAAHTLFSVKPFRTQSQRCIGSGVSVVILKPVTLTVKMGSSIPTREVLPSGRLKTGLPILLCLLGSNGTLGTYKKWVYRETHL